MSDTAKKHRKNTNLPHTIGLSFALFMIVIIMVFYFNDIKTPDFFRLQSYMKTEAHFNDGSVIFFENGDFGTLSKNEKIIADITIPTDVNIPSAELYLPLYNAIVNVYIDGELIYEDEYFTGNISRHYGNYIYEIPLPTDYAGRTLTLDITSVVSMPFSDLDGIGIISSKDAWKRIINGESLIFTLAITIMFMAMICVFYFTIKSIYTKKIQLGLPIAFFELLIIAWFFGSIRMFYLIIGNVELCSKIEYYSLYLAPLPLAAFIYTVIDVPAFKKLIFGTNCMYLLFYLTATAIELSPVNRNYSDMLPAMHLLSGITIFVLVIALFFGTKNKSNSYVYILRFGVLISMLCGILEILRFNITKYILNRSWVTTHGVSALAILIIAVSLVIYLISFSTDEYTSKIEKEQLMFLAYKDALTNMPNRASCYKRIEEMEEQGIKECTMIFIDVNNLKTANDVYGHETGDALLKITADNIMEIFSENGFCARWGGDEFVACVFDKEKKAKKLIEEFEKRIADEDAKGTFPFKVSAACGHKYINPSKYMDPLEAIREADGIMYENKKRMKSASQA